MGGMKMTAEKLEKKLGLLLKIGTSESFFLTLSVAEKNVENSLKIQGKM